MKMIKNVHSRLINYDIMNIRRTYVKIKALV
jgi:hypothetical protein